MLNEIAIFTDLLESFALLILPICYYLLLEGGKELEDYECLHLAWIYYRGKEL